MKTEKKKTKPKTYKVPIEVKDIKMDLTQLMMSVFEHVPAKMALRAFMTGCSTYTYGIAKNTDEAHEVFMMVGYLCKNWKELKPTAKKEYAKAMDEAYHKSRSRE